MINKIDFLSPPITLFYLERRAHTSKLGALLVIALIIICLSYTTFLIYDLISHQKMTLIVHKKLEYDAKHYSFNSSSIFNFIQIYSSKDGGYYDKFESKFIRAFITYSKYNVSNNNLDLYDHWVFDTCRKNIDDKDLTPSLLGNIENFTNGICIRYYYNSFEKKYYSIEHKEFKWPYLEHHISNRKTFYLTTIVQKCSNDSIINELFGKCPSPKEIDNYLSKYSSLYFYFTDNQVDPTNFETPTIKHMQIIKTNIKTSGSIIENHLHFSPVSIKTRIGSILGEDNIFNSFYFNFNRKEVVDNADEKYFTITKYYYLIQNKVQIYERRYDNIIDIIPEIGGMSQFIFYVFFWINYVYNQFIVDFDTNYLFFSIKDNNQKSKENNNIKITSISNKINISGNDNRIFNIQNNFVKLSRKGTRKVRNSKFYVDKRIKNEDNNNFQEYNVNIKPIQINQINKEDNGSSEIENINKNNDNQTNMLKREKTLVSKKIIDDNSKDILYNLNLKKKFDLIENQDLNNKNNRNNYSTNNLNNLNLRYNRTLKKSKKDMLELDINNKKDENKKISIEQDEQFITNVSISKSNLNKINYGKGKPINLNNDNNKRIKHFSFFYYIKSFLSKKARDNYQYLSLFRKHLLSEEHLFKSHINSVLLRNKYNINENETTNVFECYNEL